MQMFLSICWDTENMDITKVMSQDLPNPSYTRLFAHKNPRDIYAEKLISQGIIDANYVKKQEEDYKSKLEQNLQVSRTEETTVITPFMEDEWTGYERVDEKGMHPELSTAIDLEVLTTVAKTITNVPPDKKFLRKIERLIAERNKMFFETDKLDWAMGELLAYGTLLSEGYNVRLSGQDVERGTFSHRHAVLKAESSEEEVILLLTY